MDDAILQRISRIYAAIGPIEKGDPGKPKATVIETERIKAVFQNFRGGFSNDELSNQAHTFIHNIANLRDHLRQWAAQNGQDKNKVDQTVDNCFELKIVQDLSNNDKHGYPPRDGGHSRKCPQLNEINRVLRLQTQAKKGSMIAMTLGAGGVPKFLGDGTDKGVVTGDVVDNHKNRIGDLYEIANKAVEAWERLLADFGLIPVSSGTKPTDEADRGRHPGFPSLNVLGGGPGSLA